MRRVVLGVITICLSLIVLAQPGSPTATTSPGKNAVFVSATAIPLPLSPGPLLSGTIAKGKKKKVLALEAMLTNGPYTPVAIPEALSLIPFVNGFPMEPSTSGVYGAAVDCGAFVAPVSACTVTGTWWLDLDAAEVAHPGMFIGKPLNITLNGGALTGAGVGASFDVTLTARLQAK